MKKITKAQARKKTKARWNEKIKTIRDNYNNVRSKNKALPAFSKTDIFKDLENRKTRALKRVERREEINKRKRLIYEAKKEVEKVQTGFKSFGTSTVFEAYSGKGRIFEQVLVEKNKDKKFYGIVQINDIEKETERGFFSYSDFRIFINRILERLYEKKGDGYEAFRWDVEKLYFITEKEFILKYIFTNNGE